VDVVDPEQPDSELVARAKTGDRAAFAIIYRRHGASLYRFARSLCGAAAAEDIVHDVFVTFMRALDRYDSERAPLQPYLFGIARNIARLRIRRARRTVDLAPMHEQIAADDDAASGFAGAERRTAVRAALAMLPQRYRDVIVLCDLHGLDYENAALVLKVPIGTVRSRLHRGRHMLAERLARSERPIVGIRRALWRKL